MPSLTSKLRPSPRSILSSHGPWKELRPIPGVGPAPLMPPAVFAVSWLKALSFRLSLAPLQLLNDKVELVHAGLNNAAYGRPAEKAMMLLSIQPESNARPVPELVSFSSRGW